MPTRWRSDSDSQYWEDFSGELHGPEIIVSATVRIGRAITIMEAITTDALGATIVSEDQFHTAITTAVQHARAAMSGEVSESVPPKCC